MGKNSLRKKIMLKGVTTTPDDYLCEDGELAGAMGVENTDGGMTGVSQHGPEKVMKMASGHRVAYEHKVKPAYNWIVWDESSKTVGYVKDNTEDGRCVDETGYKSIGELRSDTMPGVEAIGNTLMVRCSEDGKSVLHYVLWKPETNTYKYLGTHIPEVALQFGLGIDYVIDFNIENNKEFPYLIKLPEEIEVPDFTITKNNKAVITSSVMASINKVQYKARKEGYFTQPFLVRYALKMYDGSTIMASAPVYMPVTEKKNDLSWPLCVIDEVEDDELRFHTEHVRSKLKYRVLNTIEEVTDIKEWSDIITGVEVYVSAPLYTYNPGGEIEKTFGKSKYGWDGHAEILLQDEENRISIYGNLDGVHLFDPDVDYGYMYPGISIGISQEERVDQRKAYKGWSERKYLFSQFYNRKDDTDDTRVYANLMWNERYPDYEDTSNNKWWTNVDGEKYSIFIDLWARKLLLMPEKSKMDFDNEVRDCSRFYKITSIDLKDLKTKNDFVKDGEDILEELDIKTGILQNIEVQPLLKDEYRSHDTVTGCVMNTYNARLNMAAVNRQLWSDFYPEQFLMHYDERRNGRSGEMLMMEDLRLTIEIADSERTIVVKSRTGTKRHGRNEIMPYFYYPNPNAKKAYLETGPVKTLLKLEEHSGLNGAVYFDASLAQKKDWERYEGEVPEQSMDLSVDEQNKIYTSEAENPWLFEPTNINTIGEGKILGMGAVTTALSQGQHGSFPMYCFTTEGIWSLSVNETGGWKTSQTVTRDVMKEGSPILLIDDAIIFMSGQGMMMLQGDRTTNMTYDQKKRQTIRASRMAGLMRLIREKTLTDFTGLITDTMTDEQIADVLTSDMMSYMEGNAIGLYYDYVNQRVMMGCYGKDTKPMSWVYYLDKRQWTVAPWKLMNRVNTYPECYAMLQEADGTNYMIRLDTMERSTASDGEDVGKEDDILLLTRPMKLGETADALKELENLKVEGLYEKSKLGMAVWGTRDYRHWHLVGSCKGLHLVRKHGSGYLAFVLAIVGKLGKDDYLDSLTVEYQLRYGQKLHGMGYKET